MIQLEPREYFTIVKQIGNHTDSTTYYVRATIRNARTDALIDTVNLADKGNRRFTYNWQVPADVSGLGFYISILSEVYTDSNYTTKSSRYADEMNTYLIQTRNKSTGGGGGVDVDYKRITKIVSDLNKELLSEVKIPTPVVNVEKTDLGEVLKSLKTIQKGVDKVCNKEDEKIDLRPIVDSIKALHKEMCDSFESILNKKEKEIDFSPILKVLEKEQNSEIKDSLNKLIECVKEIEKVTLSIKEYTDIEKKEKKDESEKDKQKQEEAKQSEKEMQNSLYKKATISAKVSRLTN